MYDVKALSQGHDLRVIVADDLGAPRYRTREAHLWRCPFHSEQKGYSLAVWRDGWRCFGACQTGGDIISWVQKRQGLSFTEACTALGATKIVNRNRHRSVAVRQITIA